MVGSTMVIAFDKVANKLRKRLFSDLLLPTFEEDAGYLCLGAEGRFVKF